MFDEFLKSCLPTDAIKPSKKRVKKNIAAVLSLIEKEDAMTKRRKRTKRILVTALITVFALISLFAVANAATDGSIIKFIMGGREIEGDFNDYVDSKGYRHVTFKAVLPIDVEDYAIIYDTDAPWGEGVRVITDETDPDFMDKLRQYKVVHSGPDWKEANAEDFGLVFKDSEICHVRLSSYSAILGGEFMHTGAAAGMPSGFGVSLDKADEVEEDGLSPHALHYDWENGIKILKETFYYYVG